MATTPRKPLLETSALIVGYAMSRLDKAYLDAQRLKSWKEAFRRAGEALKVAPAICDGMTYTEPDADSASPW